MILTATAHAKINWSLNILGMLPNGYHDLDMLMQPISLSDALTFAPADALTLTVNGAPGDANDLVLKAARALREIAQTAESAPCGARITLHKRIPARAGLGGGSADCAETLKTLNQMWNLRLPMSELLRIGAKIGADVPFCLTGGLARVSGIGERIEPLPGAPRCALVLITPGGGLSTPDVFREWDFLPSQSPAHSPAQLARAIANGDWKAAQALSFNALEAPAIRLLPEIGEWIQKFRDCGAQYVRMTGSGSTVFGVFDSLETAERVAAQWEGAIAAETIGLNPADANRFQSEQEDLP